MTTHCSYCGAVSPSALQAEINRLRAENAELRTMVAAAMNYVRHDSPVWKRWDAIYAKTEKEGE